MAAAGDTWSMRGAGTALDAGWEDVRGISSKQL